MSTNISTDIYNISGFVDEIQKKYMDDVSEDTLMMGMYGYLNETHSTIIQNSILASSELANEAITTRAKFEKSILAYATMYNIKDIYAIPAYMDVMIGFIQGELDNNMTNNKFTLDKDMAILIQDVQFHIDYDIIISKNTLSSKEVVYSALYDMTRNNELSDLTNPYLQPPVYLNIDGDKFIFITCRIRQVEDSIIYKKIISNNILENKIVDFQFESQFANFDVLVKDGDVQTYLTPIYEGTPINGESNYCYFSFLDYKTIRIKFDRNNYVPKINTDISVLLKTTQGSNGIFKYSDDIIQTLYSNKYNYRNLSMLIKPISDSVYGADGKTIDDIQQILPKEILARDTIITTKDLQNYFNNLDSNRLIFYKRQDNQQVRLYYAYMLLKDDFNNVIPTNTIDIDLGQLDFDNSTPDRYILNPGMVLALKDSVYTLRKDITDIPLYELTDFAYSSPFTLVVNKSPLSISYYLNNINEQSLFKFKYINQNSPIQFITSSLTCNKLFIDDNNKYKYTMTVSQNINSDYNLVTEDNDGNITMCNIVPVIVLDNNNVKYYAKGKVVSADLHLNQYNLEFELETDNIISVDNKIKINNIMQSGQDLDVYAYFGDSLKISVNMYAKLDSDYGRSDDNGMVPNMNGYTLTNIYETIDDAHLFYNYSDIVKSYVKVYKDSNNTIRYLIKSVPLLRYSYITTRDRCLEFIKYLQYKKVYIDEALNVLENAFGVDLKFFNTYGKSKLFKIGHGNDYLDRVNLTLNFEVKLSEDTDTNTVDYIKKEVKDYVENLNEIRDIHMTNLTSVLTPKFAQYIKYIEFTGINNYNALYQYLQRLDLDNVDDVPEFVNINTLSDLKPDINITLV